MSGGPGPLTRALTRLVGLLPQPSPPGTLVCGLADPMLPGPRSAGGLAVLAATGPGSAPPWTAALLDAATVVVVLTDADLATLGAAGTGASIVGLPSPPPGHPQPGLTVAGARPAALDLWEQVAGPVPLDGPGVAWVGGSGSAALAAAAEAWAHGRAVVALPGAIDHPFLRAGGALRARTSLEAVEVTRLLRRAAPLAGTLAARGRRALADLPAAEDVAARLAAVLAASVGDAVAPR